MNVCHKMMEWSVNMSTLKPEAIVFDMDGTLFKTETLLIPLYHELFDRLRAEKMYEGETPDQAIFLGCLGMTLDEIWQHVIPQCDLKVHDRANELLLELELAYLQKIETELYPQVQETLISLRDRGLRLFVASNGLELYVKGVAQAHGISSLFDGLYSAGEYNTASKADLLKRLMVDHQLTSVWMVGDRSSDVEAGKKNGQTVVGCAYAAFGNKDELQGSDYIISSFEELISLYDAR